MSESTPCPICGSRSRSEALGRPASLCSGCNSLERQRALARFCERLLSNGEGRDCLEAGPASRRIFGEHLRARGWHYRCIDRWKSGNPRDPRAVSFVDYEADLTNLSMFENDEFDLFIAQHVIEEIEDYELALDEIARVLGPGGRAILEIPFDSKRERSECHDPNHFGNVWEFGADLLNQLGERFDEVEELPFTEDGYSGTFLICRHSPTPTGSPGTAAIRAEHPSSIAENELPGDEEWWSGRKAPNGALEAYVSWPSAEPRGRLELHVSTTPAARYRVSIHRLGWYGGAGGRTVAIHPNLGDVQGAPRSAPEVASGPSVPSCGWPVTDTIQISGDWTSGQYVVKLTLTDGEHRGNISLVPFVVRAPLGQRADILIQMPVTTAAAYNNWGGKSLYPSNSSDGVPAVKVSFDRPIPSWHDANLNARWPFIWDIQLIRFLEREGYDVAYTTDLDTHREPWRLLGHPLVMTSGHDEYWSAEMRDAFEAVRESGASLAFMGANTCYWQARFEDGEGTMVEYRHAQADPVRDPPRKTVRFRDLEPPRPECELLGVQYQDGLDAPNMPPRDYELTESCLGDSWLKGTGFEHPTTLKGLVGYEWDGLQDGARPADATVFFHHEDKVSDADAVRHRTPAGGIVFAAGSLQFSWGLDDWGRPGHADERLQRFMRNALDEMIAVGKETSPTKVDQAVEELPLPPEGIRFMGESDQQFLDIGDECVADLRELVQLSERDRVLDVGCGYGRLVHALLRDSRYAGHYLGIDILPGPIDWCRAELEPRSAGLAEFREIEVENSRYRPEAATPGHEAQFGVEERAFDVVTLISVFTHLDPPTIERYLSEIAKALAPGGRAFISAFLLDETWRAAEATGRSGLPMTHELTPFCRFHDKDDPLAAIGYEPGWLLSKVSEAGLELISPPRLGTWCGRPDGSGYQDAIALRCA